MAEEFYKFYHQMQSLLGERTHLVGSGNGIRRNRLLAEILATPFEMPLYIPVLEEEAATGAALLAAFGAGEFARLEDAARILKYSDAINPTIHPH